MSNIINFFIKRSFLVNLISIFICIVGLIAYSGMSRGIIPNFEVQLINIKATLPGSSAVEMEKHVTFPIEEVLKNITGIEKIVSKTYSGVSLIDLKFKSDHENIEASLELVKSGIESIHHNLPQDLRPIHTTRFTMDTIEAYSIDLNGIDELNDSDRQWVKSLQDSLLKIHGIVKVGSSLKKRHIFIDFDKSKVMRHGIDITNVRSKIASALRMTPIGSIEGSGDSISVVLKKKNGSLSDLKMLPILGNRSGNTLYLKDIADVEYRFAELKDEFLFMGKSTLHLNIFKDLNSDIIVLRDKINKRLQSFQAKLPPHITAKLTADAASFIERQISTLKKNGFTGLFLVLIILYIFLGARVSIMTAIGIPISYFGTFIVLQWLGVSIDLISIVGMILVIGILVDDAIIVAENYVLNLQKGIEPNEAALNAVKSTIIPVTGTIITTIVAFAPMILIKSEASAILFAIPAVIITALIFSWFESFFILPNHLVHFVKDPSKSTQSKFHLKLTSLYRQGLTRCLRFRYVILGAISAFMIFSIYWATSHVPKDFNLSIGGNRS